MPKLILNLIFLFKYKATECELHIKLSNKTLSSH